MADPTPPKQVSLDVTAFPAGAWATSLVGAFNQFVVQTVQAFALVVTKYKVLTFTTRSSVAASFPINVQVDSLPLEVRVAGILAGTPNGAVTVVWEPLSSGKAFRVRNITGLAVNSSYQIRLAYL